MTLDDRRAVTRSTASMSQGSWLGGFGRQAWPYLLLTPTVVLLFIFTLYPLAQGVWMSFFTRGIVVVPQVPSTHPVFVGFDNFIHLLDDTNFRVALFKTIGFVIVAVPLQLAISLALAVLLSPQTRFYAFVRTIVFFPSMISMIIIGVIWAWLFGRNNGLINYGLSLFGINGVPWLENEILAQIAVVIVWVWGGAGFNMMVLIAGLTAIPKDLYEAAAIDNTSKWRQFTRITLPLLQPSIMVVLVLGIIEAFKVYELVVSLTTGGPGRATVYLIQNIYETAFNATNKTGIAAAQSMVLFVILMVLTVLQLRFARKRS